MDPNLPISPEELERIERYLTGQMPEQEHAQFNSELAGDPSLQAKTDEVRLLLTGIRETALADQLQEYHRQVEKQTVLPERGKVVGMKRWLVAASVVAILGIAGWLIAGQFKSESKIFEAYFEKDPGLISAMSSTSDNYNFDRSMIDYKNGQYNKAIIGWQLLVKAQPASDTLNYFLGSAYLANGEAANAIPLLKKVAANKASVFQKEAYWYQGLAELKQGNKTEAVKLINQSDHKDREAILAELGK